MTETVRQVDIDAPPNVVWTILEDVRRMPELSPSTEGVVAPDRLTRVGQQFEQTVRLAGQRFHSRWTVMEIEPGKHLAISGRLLPGARYRMIEDLEPDGDGTTLRLTMRWKLPFGPLGKLADKLGAKSRAVTEADAVLGGVQRLAEQLTRVVS